MNSQTPIPNGRRWLLLAILVLSIALHPAACQESSSATTTGADAPSLTENITILANQQPVAAGCSSEGQWNCMRTSWQRCASGRWSVVMQCAAGTICTPDGLTNDFRVQASSSGGAYTGGGTSSHARGETSSLGLVWAMLGLSTIMALLLS